MKIAISGAVGSGKTTVAKELAKSLGFDVLSLNDTADKYKLEDVEKLQTFEFDLDKMLGDLEEELKLKKNIVVESHFSHFLSADILDFLFVLTRDLSKLKEEYLRREYNLEKIEDNLEVESFNLCFYEAEEEGWKKPKLVAIENNGSIDECVEKIIEVVEAKH